MDYQTLDRAKNLSDRIYTTKEVLKNIEMMEKDDYIKVSTYTNGSCSTVISGELKNQVVDILHNFYVKRIEDLEKEFQEL